MHIYNVSGLSVVKQSRLPFQQSSNCSLCEFLMEMSSSPCSLPTQAPSRLDCLIVFGSLPAVTAAATAENQLNLTGIYAPCSFIGKQKFGLFF